MPKNKVTFKYDPQETGLAGVGQVHRGSDVKHKKQVIGRIAAPSWNTKDNLFRNMLAIKTERSWKWITFKVKHVTSDEAREWWKHNIDGILEKYDVHYLGD